MSCPDHSQLLDAYVGVLDAMSRDVITGSKRRRIKEPAVDQGEEIGVRKGERKRKYNSKYG